MDEFKRNPTIIPAATVAKRGCPKCGGNDYGGRNIQGSILFTCRNPECLNKWAGGQAQVPVDETKPRPPEDPLQTGVRFHKNSKDQVVETHRPVNTTQEFRKGAPAPSGDEDV